ncbi:MAG TPA: hypothetical protein VI199_14720 [Novosphingobium sp.]
MREFFCNTFVSFLALSCQAAGAEAPSAEIVIPASRRYQLAINGTSVSAEVSPSGSNFPALSAALAHRLALKTDFLGSLVNIQVRVGPQVVKLQTGYARLLGSGKWRVIWSDGSNQGEADLVLGPGSFPTPRVTFELDPAQAGTRMVTLPLGFPQDSARHVGPLRRSADFHVLFPRESKNACHRASRAGAVEHLRRASGRRSCAGRADLSRCSANPAPCARTHP